MGAFDSLWEIQKGILYQVKLFCRDKELSKRIVEFSKENYNCSEFSRILDLDASMSLYGNFMVMLFIKQDEAKKCIDTLNLNVDYSPFINKLQSQLDEYQEMFCPNQALAERLLR